MSKLTLNLTAPVVLVGYLLLVLLVLVLEKFALGDHVYQIVKQSNDAPLSQLLFEAGKPLSRIAVLALVALAVLSRRSIGRYRTLYIQLYRPAALHFCLIAQLVGFGVLYIGARPALSSGDGLSALVIGWSLMAIITAMLTALSLAPAGFWRQVLTEQKWSLAAALFMSIGIWYLGLATQSLWEHLGDVTFELVKKIFLLVGADPYYDYAERVIGIGDFLVSIDAQCSGYEGIGLVTAFVAIFLHSFRDEFRFPRAFLLFPIGIIAIWLFNIVRIVVLIVIGSFWSPEIAVWGFHSQAGWLFMILTSVGLLYLAYRSALFAHRPAAGWHLLFGPLNPAVASLLPLVVLLASTLLTKLFSGSFNWWYPLQVILVGWVILRCLPYLEFGFAWRSSYFPLLAGVLVAALWVLLVPKDAATDMLFRAELEQQSAVVVLTWLGFRFFGAVVTVPIAEELGFRAYLLCRLSSLPVMMRGTIPFSVFACVTSSIAFGLLHGDWLAGTVAGLVFAWVRYRTANLVDAIVAHGVANLLLFVLAWSTGNWSLL